MSGTGPLLAGIDAGTSRVRTLIFGLDGTLMGEGWAKTPIEQLGGTDAQFDPEALWRAAVSASRQAVAQIDDPARIRGLASGMTPMPCTWPRECGCTRLRASARCFGCVSRHPMRLLGPGTG